MIKNGKMTLLIHIVLTLFTILAVLPFILMFMSSITDESMIFQNGYSFIPDKLSADAYRYVLVNLGQIGRAYGVTVFITVSGTVVNLLITAMLAYSLSRPFLPCRRFFNLLVVLTLLFNGGLVPTYLVYTQIFHIKNTVWALLLPNLLMSPFHVILAKTYFINSIPSEIMDAATIDGAGEIRIFFRLVLPLAKPMIVTIGLFSGIAYWNDWMNSLYYITNVRLIGIQSYLNRILSDLQYLQSNEAAASMSGDISFPGMSIRMAIATIAILPIVILFTIFQKHFVRGIAMGALKG